MGNLWWQKISQLKSSFDDLFHRFIDCKEIFYVLCEKEGFFQAFTSLFGKTLCES